jgi:hypothetical protein
LGKSTLLYNALCRSTKSSVAQVQANGTLLRNIAPIVLFTQGAGIYPHPATISLAAAACGMPMSPEETRTGRNHLSFSNTLNPFLRKDLDGSVASVKFFVGNTAISTDTSSPYTGIMDARQP